MKDSRTFFEDRFGTRRPARSDRNGGLASGYDYRGVTATGSATLTRAQEIAIIAGVAGQYTDIVQVAGANTSSVAITVDIRCGTAGSVCDEINIPAGSTIVKNYDITYPSNEPAQAWTAQVNGSDISDSPVTVTMLGVRNV